MPDPSYFSHDPTVGGQDVLTGYDQKAFVLAGYAANDVQFVNDLCYNNQEGEVHCATNAIRQIGLNDWWSVT